MKENLLLSFILTTQANLIERELKYRMIKINLIFKIRQIEFLKRVCKKKFEWLYD